MTPNGWKQLSNIWFGIIVCDARSRHATVDFEIGHFRAISRGEDLLFCFVFLLNKAFACCSTEILVSAPWSIILVAAFSVDHVCPFKYRTCHSEREQNSDLQLAWRKIRTRKQNALRNHEIAQKQSLYNDLFTDSRKNTFRMWKTAKKWHFIS